MKQRALLPFLLCMAISNFTPAQFPGFPDSNATWVMSYYETGVFQNYYGYHIRETDQDTLINGTWYNSLWVGMEGQNGSFAGGLRQDTDDKVFYFHPNTYSEYLLYDLDPVMGDSMEAWVGEYNDPSVTLVQMHVASIELLMNGNGTPYKRIGILSDLAINMGENVTTYWIEGVGGSEGLLSTDGAAFTPLGASLLECMQYNDTLWPDGLPGFCGQLAIADMETSSSPWFYPSITSEVLYLKSGLVISSAAVFSSDGRLVLVPLVKDNIISVAGLKPGGYWLRAVDGSGRFLHGRFLRG